MNNKTTYPVALLGLVADYKRKIKSGYEYDRYFPKAQGSYDIVNPNGNVKMTVDEMDNYVHQTLADTAKIAPLLKGKTIGKTCENIWNFIYKHIQYKLDKDGIEELRRPRRAWADRFTGVDCDCMSIFASSILTNLGIKHKFRITKYGANWQHVYVIVPLPDKPSHYYVIDCVLNQFNYQKTYTDKFDHRMETKALLGGIPIARLGSIGETTIDSHDELQAILSGSHIGCLEPIDGLGDSETQVSDKPFLDSILQHIIATRDYIRKNPDSVTIIGGAKNHLKMLDYAIAAWNTPNREAALDILAKEEQRWNKENPSMNGVEDAEDEYLGNLEDLLEGIIDVEEYLEGLGKLKLGGAGKKFFTNIKKSVQTVKQTVQKTNQKIITKAKEIKQNVDTKVKETAKKVIAKTKEVAKKVGAAIKKFLILSNPLTLLMRSGFLMAMKVNLFGMAERLYPALLSQADAAKAGINVALWSRSRDGLDKVAKVFEAIGGKRSKLEKYIRTGRAKKKVKLNGIGALGGEPYTTAAAIIAAAASLLTAASKMKQAGINQRDYEALKRQSAQQKLQRQSSNAAMRGFGNDEDPSPNVDDVQDVEIPEQEQFDTDGSGNIDESKKGLAKFIDAIKKFFSRNKKVADQPMTALMQEEQRETPSSPSTAAGGSSASSSAVANEVANSTESSPESTTTEESYESEESESSEEGFFAKAGRFVKENPGKTIVGATLITGALILAFSPKARQAVFGKKQKQPALNGIGKVVKYRRGKRVKRSKRFLPKNSHVKRIVLK